MSSIKTPPKPIFDLRKILLEERDNKTYDISKLGGNFPKTAPCYAIKDYEIAVNYLIKVSASQDTFSTYRRDLERLHLWSWLVQRKSIQNLNSDDIDRALAFMQKPPESWVGLNGVNSGARFKNIGGFRKPSELWRPYVLPAGKKDTSKYRSSHVSLKAFIRCISAYYRYLTEEDIINKSPVRNKDLKKHLPKDKKRKILRITKPQWDYVLRSAEKMAELNPHDHERTLFIVNALFGLHLRIIELTGSDNWVPRMSSFYEDEHGWWFECFGKGAKEREVVVSKQMLKALKRYRKFRGFSGLPGPNDDTILIPNARRKNSNESDDYRDAIRSTRQIRALLESVFDNAHTEMKQKEGSDAAARLKECTVHWLRHTSISESVKERDITLVSKEVGHEDIGTTAGYIDHDRKEHQKSGKNITY